MAVGGLNLGGGIAAVYSAVGLAVEKGEVTFLTPVSELKRLVNLSDDTAETITIQFYLDGHEALLKAVGIDFP